MIGTHDARTFGEASWRPPCWTNCRRRPWPQPRRRLPATNNVHDLGHDLAAASLFYGPNDIHTDIWMPF